MSGARVAICGDQTPVVLASADALVQHRCLRDECAWGRTLKVGLGTCDELHGDLQGNPTSLSARSQGEHNHIVQRVQRDLRMHK